MDVKNLPNQSSFPTRFFPKLALGLGALALLSTVLTYLDFNKEELPIIDPEAIKNKQDSPQT